jgi:hypothetical protein
MAKFKVGDKVTYTNFPDIPGRNIQAIIYDFVDRPDRRQYFLLHYSGKKDYGPYRSIVSDNTPTLRLDPNPPIKEPTMTKVLKPQYEEYFDDDISGLSTEELVIVHELVLAKLFDMEHTQKTIYQLPDEEFRSKQEQLVLLEKRIRKAFACE